MSSGERESRLLIAALTLWALGGVDYVSEGPGRVEGLVLSPEGKPVAGARVSALEVSRPFVGQSHTALGDEKGHFLIAGLEPSPYMVYTRSKTIQKRMITSMGQVALPKLRSMRAVRQRTWSYDAVRRERG